jgi:DNA-binding SARP family transcriptional activator
VSRLSIALLGPPRIAVGDQPLVVDTKKAIAVLAYLATVNQPRSRDALAVLFWPEYDQERARASLRRTLSALKKGLGPTSEVLEVSRDQIAFKPGNLADVDVAQFTSLLAETERHTHAAADVCESCFEPLTRAVALQRGDFLAGFSVRDCAEFDEWQRYQSEAFGRAYAVALDRLATIASRLGKHAEALEAAHTRVRLDPLDEPAQRRLMQTYAWAGDRNAALQQYRLCVRLLDDELGVAPLPETTELAERIRENRAPPPSISSAGHSDEASSSPPDGATHTAPLVGRAPELRELLDTYERTTARGCLIVLEGEPGIGKTRLAETFIAEVRDHGAAVVAARCYEGESGLAYAAIADGLRAALRDPVVAEKLKAVPDNWLAEVVGLFPELAVIRANLPPPLTDQSGASVRLVEGLRLVLVALLHTARPGVLFLDDIQWADDASLDVLHHVVRHFRDHPLFILLTCRDEEGPASRRIRGMLADAHRSGTATTLRIERLRAEDVVELVATSPHAYSGGAELAAKLHHQTEGLPLFLVACLEAFVDGANPLEDMPTGVRDLLRARLSGVSETARQLLGTAAVIGRSFELDILLQASGRTEEEAAAGLDELLARRLVREVDAGNAAVDVASFDFTHELLRQVVYEDLSRVRRRLLHRRVGDALRAAYELPSTLESDPGQIAAQYQSAGLHELAAEYYCRAAERAQRLHANTEALAHFEAALALGHPEAARLRESIGDLQALIGAYGPAAISYDLAASHASPAGLPVIERKLGSLFVRQGAWESAESHFEAALEQLNETDGVERAHLQAAQSLAAHRQGHLERASTLAIQALQTAELASDPRALAECHNIVGMLARHRGDFAEAAQHLQSSLDLATATADAGARVAALNNLALLCAANGEPERALDLLDEALAVCNLVGDRHHEAALVTNMADVLRASGRTSEARERVKTAVAILADIGADLGSLQPEIWKLTEW